MGLDLKRFIGEIDDEFLCSICTMVLENPFQSPCDHLFCSECINDWLSIQKSCPVDRRPLTNTDLKAMNRTVRNLLNKCEIKCDFDSKGCNAIVKLEGLQGHLTSCEYNPDGKIVCDKGCSLEISRREYQTSNCFTHLSINHKNEISTLMKELSNQKEHFDRLVHRQGEEIQKLSHEVLRQKDQLESVTSGQEEENKKYLDELHQLRDQFKASTQRQEQDIGLLNERTEILLKRPTKWEEWSNVKSPFDQPDILELDDENSNGFVRSIYSLEPKNSSFKVQVLNGEDFYVGLIYKGLTSSKLLADYSGSSGSLDINDVTVYEGSECKIGDIIELGIKFPLNFVNDGNASVEFYLSINEQVVTEKVIKMPTDAIYPRIAICREDTKIKYLVT